MVVELWTGAHSWYADEPFLSQCTRAAAVSNNQQIPSQHTDREAKVIRNGSDQIMSTISVRACCRAPSSIRILATSIVVPAAFEYKHLTQSPGQAVVARGDNGRPQPN